jgi:GT2 family glycosyltransferase
MNSPKVFTIVLNWNREQDTIDCLKSLEKMDVTNIDHHIVVIDNASTDNSVDAIQRFISKDTNHYSLITNHANLGFAEGNNVGIHYALDQKADWIMVINNDTEVDKKLLKNLIKTGESDSKVAVVSPKIYFAKGFEYHKDRYSKDELGKVLWYAGGQIDWDNVYGTNRGVDEVDHGQYEQQQETDFATGCCMLVRSSALLPEELFNKLYFMYMEDMEFSIKMKNRGWKIVYEPKAFLWHKIAQSSAVGSHLNDYYIIRNRLLFGMSYASLRAKIALIREAIKFLATRNIWYKRAILDFAMGRFGKGSFK